MPLSLAKLTAATAHATLDIGGETLEVEWFPKRYSSAMMHRFSAFDRIADLSPEEMVAALDTAADMLAQLVASWDFYENIADDGTPGPVVALTPERLRQCSLEVLWTILTALMGEMRMGEANGTTSKQPLPASIAKGTRVGSRR